MPLQGGPVVRRGPAADATYAMRNAADHASNAAEGLVTAAGELLGAA
ncbi:hypothetical protein OHA45_37090 [Streptomyces lydicus]|nr:hypothetical protein [Streptomyces lydicus]